MPRLSTDLVPARTDRLPPNVHPSETRTVLDRRVMDNVVLKNGRLWAGVASLVAPGIGPGERGAKPRPEINGSSTAEETGFGTVGA